MQVFHGRLECLLTNIRLGKYFGPGHHINYLIRVTEYQVLFTIYFIK